MEVRNCNTTLLEVALIQAAAGRRPLPASEQINSGCRCFHFQYFSVDDENAKDKQRFSIYVTTRIIYSLRELTRWCLVPTLTARARKPSREPSQLRLLHVRPREDRLRSAGAECAHDLLWRVVTAHWLSARSSKRALSLAGSYYNNLSSLFPLISIRYKRFAEIL